MTFRGEILFHCLGDLLFNSLAASILPGKHPCVIFEPRVHANRKFYWSKSLRNMAPQCAAISHTWISIGDFWASIINIQLVPRRLIVQRRSEGKMSWFRPHACWADSPPRPLNFNPRQSIQIFPFRALTKPNERKWILREQRVNN
jgi:hypothetical protein